MTTGPISHRITLASTPKLARVRSRFRATSSGSTLPARAFPAASLSRSESGGRVYPWRGWTGNGSCSCSIRGFLRRRPAPESLSRSARGSGAATRAAAGSAASISDSSMESAWGGNAAGASTTSAAAMRGDGAGSTSAAGAIPRAGE